MNGSDDQIAFVLPVVIIGDDDDLPGFVSAQGLCHPCLIKTHMGYPSMVRFGRSGRDAGDNGPR